jgi:hypothetical protein
MPMPYGCLNADTLSGASRMSLEKALDWWQKSMRTSKHRTFLVLSGYDEDSGREIELRKEIVTRTLQDADLLNNLIEIRASNELGLAQKLARVREILPIETLTVFAESRNAVSVKAIFRRKFGKTLEMRKFKASFEFNHRWISTSTSFAWFFRNWLLRLWFEAKRKMGRGLRKKIRYMFR